MSPAQFLREFVSPFGLWDLALLIPVADAHLHRYVALLAEANSQYSRDSPRSPRSEVVSPIRGWATELDARVKAKVVDFELFSGTPATIRGLEERHIQRSMNQLGFYGYMTTQRNTIQSGREETFRVEMSSLRSKTDALQTTGHEAHGWSL